MSRALGGALLALIVLTPIAAAHDSWISRGGLRNAAGEWCCGEGDCFQIPTQAITPTDQGYEIHFSQVVNGQEANFTEIVPYKEAQPSPDGAYWRCKRPDGTRRCFFAPPNGF